MIHSEIQRMLNSYTITSAADSRNAVKEIVQEIALQSLSQTDFFSKAAFYGGTALRVFHGLDRFSEDLSKGIPVNMFHLEQRMKQTMHISEHDELRLQDVKTMLKRHFASLDFERAKEDVLPFIKHPNSLNVWSSEFFISITEDNLKKA